VCWSGEGEGMSPVRQASPRSFLRINRPFLPCPLSSPPCLVKTPCRPWAAGCGFRDEQAHPFPGSLPLDPRVVWSQLDSTRAFTILLAFCFLPGFVCSRIRRALEF
jgi:hypothetical protein